MRYLVSKDDANSLIISDVIKGRCRLDNILLCSNEYDNLLPDELKANNVVYCEIRNIQEYSRLRNQKNNVNISFDLLIIYESVDSHNKKQFHFYTERLNKNLDIYSKSYLILSKDIDIESIRCRNLIKNIKYVTDIDMTSRKIAISVSASIDSLLFDQDVISLSRINPDSSINPEVRVENIESVPKTPDTENELSQYINHLSLLLKKSSDIQEVNKKLEEENTAKDKRISYLEYKHALSDKECVSLKSDLKDKNTLIQELRSKLDKHEKRISILQSANSVINQEMQTLHKENDDLKSLIEEEDNRRKSQLNYKIKSVINKLL